MVLGEALARDDADVVTYQFDLAKSLMNLGLTLVEADRPGDSLPFLERASGVYETILRKNPADIGAASFLAGSQNNWAMALAKLERHEEAIKALGEAIKHQRGCMERDPKTAQYRQWLSNHYTNLGKSLCALGRKEEALTASRMRFELLSQSPPEQRDIGIHYHVACEMALLVPLVGRGKAEGDLTAGERAERQSYADRAVDAFRLALADGFSDVPLFLHDEDLDPIRDREDFQRLVLSAMDKVFPKEALARVR